MSINSVTLIGRLGKDPEMKYFDSGTVQTTLTLAVDRIMGEGKQKKTDWFDVKAWAKTAEVLGEYAKKGKQIAVQGHLEKEEWTDKETEQKRSRIWVVADRVQLLGDPKSENE